MTKRDRVRRPARRLTKAELDKPMPFPKAKSLDAVDEAMNKVREAVADASEGLEELGRYNDFLEELLSDAEGWKMELEERRREEEADKEE